METGAEEPKASGGMKAARWQNLANFLTIFAALCAIGLSIWEGRENRRHNRLSVLPNLESEVSVVRDSEQENTFTMTYALENSGLGPAVLKNIVVFRDGNRVYDGTAAKSNYGFSDLLEDLDQLPFEVNGFTHERSMDEMLQAHQEHVFFRLYVPEVDSLTQWTPGIVREQVLNRYSFVFCYCSVYNENCKQVTLSVGDASPDVCR